MKLWWPHNEILIASLTAYCETRQESYYQRFTQTLAYCRKVFSDPEYGEWYGYLRRDGKPTMPSTKGSTFKGLFHLPRSLIMSRRIAIDLYKAIVALRPSWHSDDLMKGKIKVVMTGASSDPAEWQPFIGTKATRETLAKRMRAALRCRPERVVGIPVARAIFRLAFVIPNARFHEKETPGI